MRLFAICFILTFALSGLPGFGQRGGGHGGGPPSPHPGVSPNNPGQSSRAQAETAQMNHEAEINQRLEQNHALSTNLQSLLPAGANLQDASKGFKNLGQFVAAAHVSHNLNIPFDQLKAKVTGHGAVQLGKAIHSLKPEMDSKAADAEAKKAEKQAKETIKESGR